MSNEKNVSIASTKVESISVTDFLEKMSTFSDNVIILDLGQAQTYTRGHIPGAVHLPVTKIVRQYGYATGLLPSQKQLVALSEEFGLNSGKTVYLYDDEGGGWAGRMVWILDVLNVSQVVYINGGLRAWIKAGFVLESKKQCPVAGPPPVVFNEGCNIEFDELMQRVDAQSVDLLDARSIGEFKGIRQYAMKAGRIPGAVHMEWTDCFDESKGCALKCLDDLKDALQELGIDGSKTIVTYCQTHHRSGLTYLVCRLLGFHVRAYGGSWSEWGNMADTPVVSDIPQVV